MKLAMRWLAGASLGILAGCASQSGNSTTTTLPTTMNASYSSDSAGTQAEEVGSPFGAYLPPMEIDFDQLPQPVQATITQQADGAQIERIVRETKRGDTVYRVELKPEDNRALRGVLVVGLDGTLLKEAHIGEAAGAPPNR